ncbi:hypothetical protein [Winogradskyella aurantiaca]|uniref:hypothetical protein n=1 Tax=Winogradskyella aurantiaca TaxID=2219558 RepID=UPI000E1C56B5|nr:hypothetical protein [Winogradskyella aurantiaca]
MTRKALFEFEDFSWLPQTVRNGITKLLQVLHGMLGTNEVLANLIEACRVKVPFNQIVDLGSGSGGAMPQVLKQLNGQLSENNQLTLVLTDKFPNQTVVDDINSLNDPQLSYFNQSIDAKEIDHTPKGLKTMIASFHHMDPDTARNILKSAETSKEPLLIYEIAENNVPFLLWCLLLPLSLVILIIMALVMTLKVRPLSLKQVIFTYLIPVIPIIYAWDGQASLMRTYTLKDIEELLGNQRPSDYIWDIQQAKKANGKKAGYYVFGYPSNP